MQVDRKSILDLDLGVEDNSQPVISAVDVLDYSVNPLMDLSLLLKKLRYGGQLVIECNNPRGITVDVMNGQIYQSNVLTSLLYSGRKSIMFVEEVIAFVEAKGFVLSSSIITNHKYSLTIERPHVESNSL